jgi:hypothetical protein
MTVLKRFAYAALLAAAAMIFAASPGLAGETADRATRAERAGLSKLAARSAPRCRRRCAQKERVCHTEQRCGYAGGRCRTVRVCRTRCTYYETYPSNCTP